MRVAVDTGGTFTDAVAWDGERLAAVKVASSRDDPARSVLLAVERLEVLLGVPARTVVLGTTVATNALLERRGARVALVVARGFEDVLRIGRQDRAQLYALDVMPTETLVADDDVIGVDADVAAEVALAHDRMRDVGAVAVCLLRALDEPERERAWVHALRAAFESSGKTGVRVVASTHVLPEVREVERTSTTVADAYVGPAIASYVDGVARGLDERTSAAARVELRVHVSAGGSVSAAVACDRPVLTVLSGPAGGASGAASLCARKGIDTALAMDVGGTSTDVALIRSSEGGVAWTTEGVVAGVPIAVPMVDVHTIGAGGGSIVRVDDAGALRVGPESAGAYPGPAAYGRGGTRATLTDAHVVLGRLVVGRSASAGASTSTLADGVGLDRDRARAALQVVGDALGVSASDVALRACEAADFAMARALRRVSVELGTDPRDACLIAFGGAGGLHGASVAGLLGIARVIVPGLAGVLSAAGILSAPPSRLVGRGVVGHGPAAIAETFASLMHEAAAHLERESVPMIERTFELRVEARYRSQTTSVPLIVPESWTSAESVAHEWPALLERFRAAHRTRYGFDLERDVEVVVARIRASGRAIEIDPRSALGRGGELVSAGGVALGRGATVEGPDVIAERFGTTFVPAGWSAHLDGDGDLVLTVSRADPR